MEEAVTDLQDARQKLRDAVESLRTVDPNRAHLALADVARAKREFELQEMSDRLPSKEELNELARAGDWEGVKRAFHAQAEHATAKFEAELEAEADRRRTSADPYERAAQARRDGDPDWRSIMPLRWHVSRWWSIWSTPLAMTIAIIGGAIALFWWLT